MNVWRAQVKAAPAAGYCTVRRQGETSDRSVAIGRHLAAAVVNEWVLVLEDSGQCWAIALLGTAATDVPSNPNPGGGTSGSTLNVPAAWAGYRKWSPYNGNTAAGFRGSSGGAFYFGRTNSYYGNYRSEGMAVYLGLKGLSLAAAKVTFGYNAYSAFDVVDANSRLALWKAPESQPADRSSGHPAGITLIADQALGASMPLSADLTVSLPAGWIAQLVAGTANGVGLINNTMAPTTAIWGGYGVVAQTLEATYN